MGRKTSLIKFRQYATYQCCFDIYSDRLTEDDLFKKVFLIVIDWLKSRIGEESISQFPKLMQYPPADEYEKLDIKDMYGFKLLSVTDIRLFNLEEENNWALRISEPDNCSEFKSGSMDDADSISNRSFTTDVAIKKNEKGVTLAVRIECKEPLDNKRDALSFRPAFVKTLYKDNDIVITESSTSRAFAFSNIKCDEKPIIIDKKTELVFRDKLLNNSNRNLPIIICPESIFNETATFTKYVDGKKVDKQGGIGLLAYSVMGYAHVIVISDEIIDDVFNYKKSNCIEYVEKLKTGYAVFHSGVDSRGYVSLDPIYVELTPKKKKTDNEDAEISLENKKKPLLVLEEMAKKYSVREHFDFGETLFYRELKKYYYENIDKSELEDSVSNLEHEIEELKARNADLETKLIDEKNDRARTERTLKLSRDDAILKLAEYRQSTEKPQRIIDNLKGEIERLNGRIGDLEKQNGRLMDSYESIDIPKPEKGVVDLFNKSQCKCLIDCDKQYKNRFFVDLAREKIIERLKKEYVLLKVEYRRRHLIEILIQYNKYMSDQGKDTLEIIEYPTKAELYPGEMRDVIFDVLFSKLDNSDDNYLNELAKFNNYNGEQKAKKEEIKNKVNGYRNISNIEPLLSKYGFYLKSSNNHYVFMYYNHEKYKVTAACTPSDRNAGKNLAEELIDMCL